MKYSDDEILRFEWKDQVSMYLFFRAMQQSVRPAITVSFEALAVGVAFSMISGKLGMQGVDWYLLLVGFILLIIFVFAFVLVGHLLPPAVLFGRGQVVVASEHSPKAIRTEDVKDFRVEKTPNWYSFLVVYEDELETGAISFKVAIRSTTDAKSKQLIALFKEAQKVKLKR